MKTVAALPSFNSQILRTALGVVIGVALLVVSAKIQIPFWPVPLTMQTAAVLMLPFILGGNAGVASVAIYLGLGAAGYPVFAHASALGMGPLYFAGPTGGFLAGFMLAAGAMALAPPYVRGIPALLAAMLAGHAVIFACGVAWLAYGLPQMGMAAAVAVGFTPFVLATLVKTVFAAMCVRSFTKPAQAS